VALKHKTVEYYKEFHEDFRTPIREAISNALNGCIYPKVSFTLAVYNKEPTILGLVEYLDRVIRQYPSAELHVIFDGCTDKSEKLVRKYYRDDPGYKVSFSLTPNIFEIKTNNLGLKRSDGKYCVIVQDDNYVYDRDFIYEAVNFLDKDSKAVILGCLAGVNFYPRGTTGLRGKGQITVNEDEVYWRQDANTDANLKNRIFQVDACMRGPLFIRKSFLAKTGYLDEVYAPLYEDDMDLGMRAGSLGYKVYCALMDVENKSLSMAHADPEKSKLFAQTMKRNTDIFYKRWKPSVHKDYSWVNRIKILNIPEPELTKSRLSSGLWQKIIGG
jgi:GT2 family glycosyltransferase